MKALARVLLTGLVQVLAIGVMLFAPAGTFHYWQAWVVLAVFTVSIWIPSGYLQLTNPASLERRMRGGPAAEGRTVQKLVMAVLYLSLVAMCVVGGLDHRFGWSLMPPALCVAGAAVLAVGMGMIVVVANQNTYASTTVQVEAGQQVVSTGLYGLVRHPMYSANTLMLAGLPLAVGSYWALLFVLPGVAVLASRIRDEEALLCTELSGYADYTRRVRYRLVPGIW